MAQKNIRLTDTQIRNATPKDKNYFLFDTDNLRLLVRPTGTRVWQLPYVYGGKNNIYTIGRYPKISMKEARNAVSDIKQMLDDGIDPNQQKKAQKAANIETSGNTFKAIAEEWYSKQTWSPKYANNIKSRLEKDVFNKIGFKPITEVTVPDIVAILQNIEDRGAGDVARRIGQYCTHIFEYAISKGICDQNPAMGRSRFLKPIERKNRDHMQEDELPDFLEHLEDATQGTSLLPLIAKLQFLTALRPGEVRNARWEEINEEEALWYIPAKRMKKKRDHIVPLSKQALELIQKLRTMTGNKELIFPGKKLVTKPFSDVALIKTVKKLSDGKSTPHGFRHTISTILTENGFHEDYIETQLAHLDKNKVRATYNKAIYLEPRRKMMQWWADYLDNKLEEAQNG